MNTHHIIDTEDLYSGEPVMLTGEERLLLKGLVRDAGFVTISEVRLSRDLGHARVFVSILGEPAERRRALKQLLAAGKHLRMELAARLRIRAVPELHFQLDESLDRVESVENLLKQIEEERGERPPEEPS